MIFDYLIDFEYLAIALKTLEPGDPTLENFKKIVDVCRRADENGRLVLDSERKILADLKAMEFLPSRFGQRIRYVIEECFLRALPAGRFDRRQAIGVERNDKPKICVRDIPVFERNVERIMEKLCAIIPAPHVTITNREDWGDVTCMDLSCDEVFDAVDFVRGSAKGLQRVILDGEYGGIPLEEFWDQLHTFGAAEESGFDIYDPYSFDCNTAVTRENLMRWIVHLLGGRNAQRRHVQIRIYSRCGENDYADGIPVQLSNQFHRLKVRLAEEEGLSHLSGIVCNLQFMLAVENQGDEVFAQFRRDVQHDRYICSSTHFFGIGSGIDSISKRKAFNVQYAGRVGSGVTVPLLEELSSFYSDPANQAAGRIRTFSCQI